MTRQEIDTIAQSSITLAASWQKRANALLTHEEEMFQEQMKALLSNPLDKVVLMQMIDQSFRSRDVIRVSSQIYYLFKKYGIPDFLRVYEKAMAYLFMGIGRHFPGLSVPKVMDKIRNFSSRTIIPGEPEPFHAHLGLRKRQGVKININQLGEAVLGEEEAQRRLNHYLELLREPEIECISVKISSIYSQIHSLAYDHCVGKLIDRLSLLLRTAASNPYNGRGGQVYAKIVTLDMEEYRDLHMTTDVFMATLSKEEFKRQTAGIALQAYIPESYTIQEKLTKWAMNRVADGGSPIKIRIVKGANLEMEQVEAALMNWPLATYDNKKDVDANFKKMVAFGMQKEHVKAVHIGIASHNLFDLAFAYKLAEKLDLFPYVMNEMLEGMADHVRRAINETSSNMLLYAPVATREQFINAIAYLVRRLDENTGEENFLRYACQLVTGSEEWNFLKNQFIQSYNHQAKVSNYPKRSQNRGKETVAMDMGTYATQEFFNEPDTDWSQAGNRKWAEAIRDSWRYKFKVEPLEIPLVIGGAEVGPGNGDDGSPEREAVACLDPSHLPEKIVIARYPKARKEDIEKAVTIAKEDPDHWRNRSLDERHAILAKVAEELRKSRGDLIGAAALNTGKVFIESDPEVSEAIDFVEYYPFSVSQFQEHSQIKGDGKGVGLVVSPWNFPIAIPCGGITAALASGNTVIFKPSSEAVMTAYILCQCFWRAGVSRNTLQFLPCSGALVGTELVSHPYLDFIILTGGTDTALKILKQKPDAFLVAETGGKNTTIVTAMADRDQAIKNVVHSAFSHSGQKCSATSLLILEQEIYADKNFRKHLVDAAKSLGVGSCWEFQHKMAYLIKPPDKDLKNALNRLEVGESWALEPRQIGENPLLWTPGIKYGVRAGSYSHRTEFFGPVLGVMCAENLSHAIEMANQTGYGLTAALESLDEREQDLWKKTIEAGNLYINKGSTGAVVLRQPFGGMKKSAVGAGIKAGGPNYVSQFMRFTENAPPKVPVIQNDYRILRMARKWRQGLLSGKFKDMDADIQNTIRAIRSYLFHAEQEFNQEKDYFLLRGQTNNVRYLPVGTVMVRVHENDSLFEMLARMAAVQISCNQMILSIPDGLDTKAVAFLFSEDCKELLGEGQWVYQTDSDVCADMSKVDRIRYAGAERVPRVIHEKAAVNGFYIARAPVVMEGRIELLQYFHEQSICHNYHRYGNIGEKAFL